MNYSFLLEEKNLTIYECSKRSGIPYSTLSDIVKGKTAIEKASFETAHKLASVLDISMDELYSKMHIPERPSFENFKSQMQHDLQREGDKQFLLSKVQSNYVGLLWSWKWYAEALYTLAMIDYLCRVNNLPICSKFNTYRKHRLEETIYPMDINLLSHLSGNDDAKRQAVLESIPEFIRFNIVETEVRNVI